MKVKMVHHTGLGVRNLDSAMAFYKDTFGMEEIARREFLPGQKVFSGSVSGIPDSHIKVGFLALGESMLEIVEYVSPKGQSRAKTRPNDVGNAHVCFEVDDIEAAYEELSAKGMKCVGRPVYGLEGDLKGRAALYFWDDDGINLELISRPSTEGRL